MATVAVSNGPAGGGPPRARPEGSPVRRTLNNLRSATVKRLSSLGSTNRELDKRHMSARAQQTLYHLDESILTFNLLAYILMCIELELFMYWEPWEAHASTVALKAAITLLTVQTMRLVWRRYSVEVELRLLRSGARRLSAVDWRVLRKRRLWELAITAVHMPPYELLLWPLGVEHSGLFKVGVMSDMYEYPVDIVGTLIILRAYCAVRVLVVQSGFLTSKTKGTASLSGVHIDVEFCLKGMLRRSTFRLMGASLVLLILVASVNLRFFERQEDQSSELDYLWNSAWLVAVTITTVGYGDLVPRTHAGRGIAICSVLISNVMLAFLVAVIANRLALSHRQERVFKLLERDEMQRSIRHKAVVLIQYHWRDALRRRGHAQATAVSDTPLARNLRSLRSKVGNLSFSSGDSRRGSRNLGSGATAAAKSALGTLGTAVKYLLPIDARVQFLTDLRRYNHLCDDAKVAEPVLPSVQAMARKHDELAASVAALGDHVQAVDAKLDLILGALARQQAPVVPPLDLSTLPAPSSSAPPPEGLPPRLPPGTKLPRLVGSMVAAAGSSDDESDGSSESDGSGSESEREGDEVPASATPEPEPPRPVPGTKDGPMVRPKSAGPPMSAVMRHHRFGRGS